MKYIILNVKFESNNITKLKSIQLFCQQLKIWTIKSTQKFCQFAIFTDCYMDQTVINNFDLMT